MAEILAKAMNLSLPAGNVPIDALVEWLHNKQILIILDNCEHLLKASASLARKFLQEPGVHLLVTSREPLSVEGEVLYPVSPLSLPPLESNSADIPMYDAIRLFIERAQAVTESAHRCANLSPSGWASISD
jgi:predicted ATPase